jgi:WD40 repeat protein
MATDIMDPNAYGDAGNSSWDYGASNGYYEDAQQYQQDEGQTGADYAGGYYDQPYDTAGGGYDGGVGEETGQYPREEQEQFEGFEYNSYDQANNPGYTEGGYYDNYEQQEGQEEVDTQYNSYPEGYSQETTEQYYSAQGSQYGSHQQYEDSAGDKARDGNYYAYPEQYYDSIGEHGRNPDGEVLGYNNMPIQYMENEYDGGEDRDRQGELKSRPSYLVRDYANSADYSDTSPMNSARERYGNGRSNSGRRISSSRGSGRSRSRSGSYSDLEDDSRITGGVRRLSLSNSNPDLYSPSTSANNTPRGAGASTGRRSSRSRLNSHGSSTYSDGDLSDEEYYHITTKNNRDASKQVPQMNQSQKISTAPAATFTAPATPSGNSATIPFKSPLFNASSSSTPASSSDTSAKVPPLMLPTRPSSEKQKSSLTGESPKIQQISGKTAAAKDTSPKPMVPTKPPGERTPTATEESPKQVLAKANTVEASPGADSNKNAVSKLSTSTASVNTKSVESVAPIPNSSVPLTLPANSITPAAAAVKKDDESRSAASVPSTDPVAVNNVDEKDAKKMGSSVKPAYTTSKSTRKQSLKDVGIASNVSNQTIATHATEEGGPEKQFPSLMSPRPFFGDKKTNFFLNSVDVSGGSSHIIYVSTSDSSIMAFDVFSGEKVATMSGHIDRVLCVACSMDATTSSKAGNNEFEGAHFTVSGSRDETLRIWDQNHKCTKTIHAHKGPVWAVAAVLRALVAYAISCSDEGSIRVWDAVTGSKMFNFKGQKGKVLSLQIVDKWSSTLELISAGQDKNIHVWNLVEGHHVKLLEGHTNEVTCLTTTTIDKSKNSGVQFNMSNGSSKMVLVFSGSRDKTVRIWDYNESITLHTLTSHASAVMALTFALTQRSASKPVKISENTPVVVLGGEDGTTTIYNIDTGKVVRSIGGHPNGIKGLASAVYSVDSTKSKESLIVSCGWDKAVHTYSLDDFIVQEEAGCGCTIS